jgi:hypothetical protein
LYLNKDELMRHEAAGVTTELFPKTMSVAGVDMTLSYHFEPGSPRDGVTLTVPLYALNQVSADRTEWLVSGMLKDKVHLLLKSLPQKLRRHCVPLPDYAAGFCDRVQDKLTFGKGSLLDAVIADVREETGIATKTTDYKLETLPAHHFMNFKVIDEHGRQLDLGRNLGGCVPSSAARRVRVFSALPNRPQPRGRHRAWSIDHVAKPRPLPLNHRRSEQSRQAQPVPYRLANAHANITQHQT